MNLQKYYYIKNYLVNQNYHKVNIDKILEEQRRVGELGEELTLQYEKKYFKQKKWNYQEKNVRIVGKKNIRAGI